MDYIKAVRFLMSNGWFTLWLVLSASCMLAWGGDMPWSDVRTYLKIIIALGCPILAAIATQSIRYRWASCKENARLIRIAGSLSNEEASLLLEYQGQESSCLSLSRSCAAARSLMSKHLLMLEHPSFSDLPYLSLQLTSDGYEILKLGLLVRK